MMRGRQRTASSNADPPSVAAITLNAAITVVWLRARAGAPDLRALAETLLRTLALTALAVLAVHGLLVGLAGLTWHPLLELVAGGALYGLVSLVGVSWLGDAALRAGVDRILQRLTRRLRRKRPA